MDRVPADLDAVVIGSGIGGLTAAALLSKAGKKVVVLEQHDQAGGCTHTFQNKGFEFDVGKLLKETHTSPQNKTHNNISLKPTRRTAKMLKFIAGVLSLISYALMLRSTHLKVSYGQISHSFIYIFKSEFKMIIKITFYLLSEP